MHFSLSAPYLSYYVIRLNRLPTLIQAHTMGHAYQECRIMRYHQLDRNRTFLQAKRVRFLHQREGETHGTDAAAHKYI